jgi:hypothetical protein
MAMGQMISPGVYTRIIDLSEYLADVPGTVAFLPFLSRKGPDNKLVFTTSKEQMSTRYGEPNILDYGKAFGQGLYVAWNHLGVSSHLYTLRALPDDATYSHLMLGMQLRTEEIGYSFSSSSGSVPFEKMELIAYSFDGTERLNSHGAPVHNPAINHIRELKQFFLPEYGELTDDYMFPAATGGTGVPWGWLTYVRAVGRGDYYNSLAIRISRHVNSELFGVYILDIYITTEDGDDVIVETFNVAFDKEMVDDMGESLYIDDVVNKFSKYIRCETNENALRQMEEYKMDYYKNDPTLPESVTEYTVLDENGQATDLGYKALRIEFASLDYDYAEEVLNTAIDELTVARGLPTTTSNEIIVRNEAVRVAIENVSMARAQLALAKKALEDAYQLDMLTLGDPNPETSVIEPIHLMTGSEGSLVYEDRTTGKRVVQTDVARQTLGEAYMGLLQKPDNEARSDGTWPLVAYVDEVFDLDWIYFSLVYDAGYDPDVKDAAKTLTDVYRRDCMLISDVGDNIEYQDVEDYVGGNPAMPSGRLWNSRYVARYEPYSRIYDVFTGRDLWITPVYHMAQIIPLNDKLYELWYAPAGFNRATIDSIKELRWSPKLGERDKLYLLQVNPIVHFPEGYTVWSQLTTQKRPTALQDVNCMRLVLYIKRALEQFCKYFIFEFNDAITHEQIKRGIIPFLDRIKARRGLVDYSVDVGADEYEFKNKICHVNVYLTPMKVIEKIELNLYVK